MRWKGVYSYEYMDSFERIQEPQLPLKDAFYSSFTEEDISEIDYTQEQRVLNHCNMTDLRDCPNLYLLTDVLLLSDAFVNFRNVCLQTFGFDPAHNYTSPGLSWQMADVKWDLLTVIDQHLFMEEEIRGRLAIISHRYAQAKAWHGKLWRQQMQ